MDEAAECHPCLARQLRRLRIPPGEPPDRDQWAKLVRLVSDSYGEADDGRYTLERSIEVSSDEMRALHDVLSRQALEDELTGLPNRASLTEQLEATLARRRRGGSDSAVLFIDLDGFKRVNDSLGHAAGDELLVRTAERIRGSIRTGDVVGRLGGDEFVVLCPDVEGIEVAVGVARRIAAQLESPYHIGSQDATISASIGIALAVPGVTGEEMLRRADIAMYEAKTGGRAQLAVFDDQMRLRIDGRLALENALRNALTADELRLHYQPVVRLSDFRLLGFEALVRWQRPGFAMVPPNDFIPIAEQSRLITAIDAWVVKEACRAASGWPGGGVSVAVNLSARDLEDDGMLNAVSQALHRSRLSPHRLVVELTETMLMADSAQMHVTLGRIQALGVHLAIDDFGTGYSSLSYLRHLSAGSLKIDQSFVSAVDEDRGADAIIGAVITMAHALGLHVVAEGVERPSQAARLRQLGCDAAQGYFFARPAPAQEICRYFDAGQPAIWAASLLPVQASR